jgi:hypothetical protein
MIALDAVREPGQTVAVGGRHADLDALSALAEQAVVQTLTAQIQSSVQH